MASGPAPVLVDGTRNSEGIAATPTSVLKPPRRRKFLSLWLFLVGLMFLSYLLGAAVMFFELPTSDLLSKAFLGARAWNERRQLPGQTADQPTLAGLIDKPGKTFDGFTLYACASLEVPSCQAFLINMRREVVHRWAVSFSQVWPNPFHTKEGRVKDSLVCFFGCHLYPNGDLLVVFHGLEQLANGYGLVKLDKDSNIVWKYAANIHHDVDVGEDGTIYALEHKLVKEMPQGLEYIPTPCLVDDLVLLSSEGKLLKSIPLLEAFRDSPYAALLASLEKPTKKDDRPGRLTGPRFDEAVLRQDALHTNFAQVLSRKLAPQFPQFKAGQVLISLRHLDTIAVVDPDKRSVVWAARGPWQAQHDPQFLDNGHLLLFDNRGLPKGSRVLEYDPQTQAFPWSYAGENKGPFYTSERGMCQRLPNGNTLIVDSEGGEIFEVTRRKEVVWSCSTYRRFIATARRYGPNQLQFLKGGERARP
jgi:arylsulfotransferase ASST